MHQVNGKIEAAQSLTALATAIFRGDSSQLTFEQLQTLSLEYFSPYWIPEQIPTDASENVRSLGLAHTLRDMKQEAVFRELTDLFRANGIRFCPIKGADLAWRVYPTGALRPKCDLDILLPEQEIPQTLSLLKVNGWTAPYRYRHSHHFPQMHKNHVALELHFLLPHMKRISETALWRELRSLDPFRHRLPLELNLCMLFHHARHHGWTNGIRLLLDFGFLLKAEGAPDWRCVDDLVERFGLSSPRFLFQAFPDFFPRETIPPQAEQPTVSTALRRLILQNLQPHRQIIERVMNDPDRFYLRWWWQRLKGMSPSSIRIQTHNPQGHYGRLLLGYISITVAKWKAFWIYRRGSDDPVLLQQLTDEKMIDQYLQLNP